MGGSDDQLGFFIAEDFGNQPGSDLGRLEKIIVGAIVGFGFAQGFDGEKTNRGDFVPTEQDDLVRLGPRWNLTGSFVDDVRGEEGKFSLLAPGVEMVRPPVEFVVADRAVDQSEVSQIFIDHRPPLVMADRALP